MARLDSSSHTEGSIPFLPAVLVGTRHVLRCTAVRAQLVAVELLVAVEVLLVPQPRQPRP